MTKELINLFQSLAADYPTPTAFSEAIAAELKKNDRWRPESIADAAHYFRCIAALMKHPCK